MARKRKGKIESQDITGLKYFDKLAPLLERLHDEGCQRDKAGNRVLHCDQYCLLTVLPADLALSVQSRRHLTAWDSASE